MRPHHSLPTHEGISRRVYYKQQTTEKTRDVDFSAFVVSRFLREGAIFPLTTNYNLANFVGKVVRFYLSSALFPSPFYNVGYKRTFLIQYCIALHGTPSIFKKIGRLGDPQIETEPNL